MKIEELRQKSDRDFLFWLADHPNAAAQGYNHRVYIRTRLTQIGLTLGASVPVVGRF